LARSPRPLGPPPRAQQGAGDDVPAFTDVATQEGGGFRNGPATLVPDGDGHYHLTYRQAPGSTGLSNGSATLVPDGDGHDHVQYRSLPDDRGAGVPGVPVIVGADGDGKPLIEYQPSAPR
jgi:hypothetical protein